MSDYPDPLNNRLFPIEDRDFFSYDKDKENRLAKRVTGNVVTDSPFGKADEIAATYPTATSEVYTYKYNAVDIGTVTVTYTTLSKELIQGVVYNEL